MMRSPDGWEHVSGYRLNHDGAAIKYRQVGGGLVAYVEAMVNEDRDVRRDFEFRPSIISPTGEFVVYPDVYEDKDAALSRLFEEMEARNGAECEVGR